MKAIALIAVGAAVASLIVGCSRPNESERYLNQVSVDGYRKAGEGYETAPLAYFVGQAREDILTAVHGPGDLRVAKDDIDLSIPSMQDLGSGKAFSTETYAAACWCFARCLANQRLHMQARAAA